MHEWFGLILMTQNYPPRITDRCCKILLAKVIFLFQIIVFITFFNLFFVFSVPATKQICPQIAFPDIRLYELLDDSHDECFAYWTKWEE